MTRIEEEVKLPSLTYFNKLLYLLNLWGINVLLFVFITRLSKPVCYFVSPRCCLASWIPSYSCVLCQPVTSAQLTWLPTWSTHCTSWRPRWLSSSSLTRGLRCSSSRSAWQISSESDNKICLGIYILLISIIQGYESKNNTARLSRTRQSESWNTNAIQHEYSAYSHHIVYA